MSEMRIAQIAPLCESVPPKFYGGTERVVHNLTQGLMALGAEVTVFCSGDSTVAAPRVSVWPEALRISSQRSGRKSLDLQAYQFRMLQFIANQADDFDLIHNHYDYPLLELLRLTDTPVLTTMHNRMDSPDLAAVLECFTDAPLVSISNAQRGHLPWLNWIATIRHGIDTENFVPQEEPGTYLAFLGRFSPEKGPHWAIEIAKQCQIPLKMAAKVEELDREYFERFIKPQIDGKFIEYVGEIAEHEKSEFLGKALALVFPINWPEPFGLVMIEAMACGTPVLARPVGSVGEVMLDGVTGYVRKDISELARLAPLTARLNRKRIRSHIIANFSIERMTQEYLNAYRRLIETKAAKSPTERARVVEHRRDFLHPLDGSAHRDSKGRAQG